MTRRNARGPVRTSGEGALRGVRRPGPAGKIAKTPGGGPRDRRGARRAGTSRVVVKAQVKTGGRGKAGGVKLADSPADAEDKARQILGMDIKGHTVHKVLVEEASAIAQEYYFSFLLDRANRTFLSICSVEGGMEIEEVAATKPDARGPGADLGPDRRRPRQGPRDRDRRPAFPQEADRGRRRADRAPVGRLRRRGRHPRRGQPADPHRRTARSRPSTARSPSTTTPPSARPTTRRSRTARAGGPAGGQGQGEGPQLRQARRFGRDHR